MIDTFDPFSPSERDQRAAIAWLQPDYMDVGCGPNPLPGAKKYYDLFDWDNPLIHKINFYGEKLPELYNVYCRHVLEDIHNPEVLLEQFQKCERGWIEFPNPMYEITRGCDGYMGEEMVDWLGFAHHHWIMWVQEDTLVFCPKFITINRIKNGNTILNLLGNVPFNKYYKWKDYGLKYKFLKHDIDFDVRNSDYLNTIIKNVRNTNA